MPTISSADTVGLSKQSVWCDLNGEVAVLQVSSGLYFGLQGAAVSIWEFLQQPRTVSQVIDHLMVTFEVEQGVCERLTFAFLEELAAKELIVVETHVAVT